MVILLFYNQIDVSMCYNVLFELMCASTVHVRGCKDCLCVCQLWVFLEMRDLFERCLLHVSSLNRVWHGLEGSFYLEFIKARRVLIS